MLTRADTGAIEIASRTVEPVFTLTPEVAGTPSLIDVNAAEYLPAVREYGSPGYTPAELEDAPELGRRQADIVLAQALPVAAVQGAGPLAPADTACIAVKAEAPTGQGVELAPGRTFVEIGRGPRATISLRRFAVEEFPAAIGTAEGNSTVTLRIPRDNASQPWYLHVEAPQTARVCD